MSLTFEPETHTYRWDGQVVPSVTQILKPLSNFEFVSGDVMDAARAFGTAAHMTCELSDLRTLDEDALDPALRPYLEQWRAFCRDYSCEWDWVEGRFFHPVFRYAGTPDRIGIVKGCSAIVDIKTGTSLHPSVGPQTAAYARAFDPTLGAMMPRYAVRLHPEGYEVKRYSDPSDWALFCSLITVSRWCAQHQINPWKESKHD